MLTKQTVVSLVDSSNATFSKLFHLYGGFFRKKTQIRFYTKSSVKYLKKKVLNKKLKKGSIVKNYIVRQAFRVKKTDSSTVLFYENSSVIIKKKNIPSFKYFIGPVNYNLFNKKFLILFKDNV